MQFTMDNRNKEFARSLRQRAHELPPGDKARYGMFIAAKHIENHTTPLTTDKQAREVPRVGVKIVEMLVELGLEVSTSKRDRMHIGGANAVVPAKRRALGASAVSLLSNPRIGNGHVARRLRDFAASRTGTFLHCILAAADCVEQQPEEVESVQQLLRIPGIRSHTAKLIVTEIMCRQLREDEIAFLEGADAKYKCARPKA
jgi:hypothetical protein